MRRSSQYLLVGIVHLLERRREHVLDDDDAPLGGNHDALRRDRAVTHLRHRLVEDRNRRDELTQHADRRVEFNRDQIALVGFEHRRQPGATDAIRDNRETASKADAAGGSKGRITERRQRVHPLAQGELERRELRKLFFEFEDFDRLAFGADCLEAGAEAIVKGHVRLRRRGVCGVLDHGERRQAFLYLFDAG